MISVTSPGSNPIPDSPCSKGATEAGARAMVQISRDFIGGREPPGAEALSERLRVSLRACNEVLFQLSGQRLLRGVANGKVASFVPSEDPGRITVRRVVEALRPHGHEPELTVEGGRLEKLLAEAEAGAADRLETATMRELAGEAPGPHSWGPPWAVPAAARRFVRR